MTHDLTGALPPRPVRRPSPDFPSRRGRRVDPKWLTELRYLLVWSAAGFFWDEKSMKA
jgi:hypothetical protein